MFTRERHRRGVVYFGPYANAKKVRETLDVLNRVFPYRPCEGPQPGRHSGIPCLDYHIERCLAPCVGYVSKEDYRRGDRRRDRVPVRRDAADPARARGEDAAGGRGRALRGGGAVPEPALLGAAPRRAAGGRQAGGRDDRRDRDRGRGRSRRGSGLPAARREADRPLQLPSRERRGAGHCRRCSRRSSSSTTAPRRACRRRSSFRADVGDTAALAEFLSDAARVAGRGARAPSAARSAGSRSWRRRTRGWRSSPDAAAAEQTRLRRVEALEELREALNLESLPLRIECYDISNIQESSPVGSMVVFQDAVAEEGALPEVRDQGRGGAGRLRGARGGGLAPVRPDARRGRRGVRRVVRGDAESRRRRRRQGPALGGAGRDAGVRPAARGRDLAREARRGGLRSRTVREPIVLDRHSPGLQLLQRIRDEAHRFALGFHRQRRDSKARESIFDTLAGRRARRVGARCSSTSARQSDSSPRARRSSRACPGCRRRRRARSTRSSTRPAAPDRGQTPDNSSTGCGRAALQAVHRAADAVL